MVKKKITFFVMFILIINLVIGFSNTISYVGIDVTNDSNLLKFNGTYDVTTYVFHTSDCTGGYQYAEDKTISITDGNMGVSLTHNISNLNKTFYLMASIEGQNQTCFEHYPSAQTIYSNDSYNAHVLDGYTPNSLPVSGEVTGTLSSTAVSSLDLTNITYIGLLGFNNLTKCSGSQILQMSGGVWQCDTDSTGTDTTCSDVACTIGSDDTISHPDVVQNNTPGTWNITVATANNAGASGGNSTDEMRAAVNDSALAYVFNISCSNINDGSDTDYCVDATGASTSRWITSKNYLYNDTTTIYVNETVFNETIRKTGVQHFVNKSDWTTIDDYPNNCASGQLVRGLGDVLTCQEAQDAVWTTGIGTESGIDVTYQDGSDNVDFITDVKNDTGTYLFTSASVLPDTHTHDITNITQFGDGAVGDEDLATEDFGDFSCAGEDSCLFDSNTVASEELATDSVQVAELDDGSDTASTNDVVMIDNSDTTQFIYIDIGDCDDGSGHLNYDTTTQAFSCGTTDQGNSTAEIQAVAVGGEASGTIGSITLSNTALDDQYVDIDGDTMTGNLIVNTNVTAENLLLENDVSNHRITNNGTCIRIEVGTTLWAICE